jgi:hypothetical protein
LHHIRWSNYKIGFTLQLARGNSILYLWSKWKKILFLVAFSAPVLDHSTTPMLLFSQNLFPWSLNSSFLGTQYEWYKLFSMVAKLLFPWHLLSPRIIFFFLPFKDKLFFYTKQSCCTWCYCDTEVLLQIR